MLLRQLVALFGEVGPRQKQVLRGGPLDTDLASGSHHSVPLAVRREASTTILRHDFSSSALTFVA